MDNPAPLMSEGELVSNAVVIEEQNASEVVGMLRSGSIDCVEEWHGSSWGSVGLGKRHG
jgi:hypothetical protein